MDPGVIAGSRQEPLKSNAVMQIFGGEFRKPGQPLHSLGGICMGCQRRANSLQNPRGKTSCNKAPGFT